MQPNWFAVSREIFEHPVVGKDVPPPPPADPERHAQPPLVAWLDLMGWATPFDRIAPHKGGTVALRRGELIFGRAFWAARWNWSQQSLRTFSKKLLSHGMISVVNQSRGHSANVISLTKYDAYQALPGERKPVQQPVDQPVPNQCSTSAQPDSYTSTLNKDSRSEESARPRVGVDIGFDITDADLDEFHATLVYWGLKRNQLAMQLASINRDEAERTLISEIRIAIVNNPVAEPYQVHGSVLAAISTISLKQKSEQDSGERRAVGPKSAVSYFREVLDSTLKDRILADRNLQAQAQADHHMQKASLAKREERLEQGIIHPNFGAARPGRSSFATAGFPP